MACEGVDLSLPTGADPANWQCSIEGATLRLTYTGETAEWPPAQAACAKVLYVAEDHPTSVLTSFATEINGAIAPARAAGLVLGVASDIGIPGPVGPPGPAGPQGPVGPAGASGVGARAFAVSTGVAWGWANVPPTPIPGLDVTITTSAGSALWIGFDGSPCSGVEAAASAPPSTNATPQWEYLLEVDDVVVARRRLGDADYVPLNHIAWQTGPLAAGAHRVRVLVDNVEQTPRDVGASGCAGSALDGSAQSRLSVVELRAP